MKWDERPEPVIRNACFSCIIAFVLMLTVSVYAEERPGLALSDHAMREQLRFAGHLFQEQDYFRAIGEYKRFLFHYPEATGALREDARFKIALCYYRAQRWEEAVEAFRDFARRFPHSVRRAEADFLKGQSEQKLERYDEALYSFESATRSDDVELRNRALFESAMIEVDRKDWESAGRLLARISRESSFYPSAEIFSEGLAHIDHLPKKSPATAGTLAAVLPGAGHVYTENYRDGLVAFLLNGVFIWAAVEQFDRGNNVTGGIITFFELGWYTGNIYSALGSAHKFNDRIEEGFIQSLKARTAMSFRQDREGDSRYLVLNLSF